MSPSTKSEYAIRFSEEMMQVYAGLEPSFSEKILHWVEENPGATESLLNSTGLSGLFYAVCSAEKDQLPESFLVIAQKQQLTYLHSKANAVRLNHALGEIHEGLAARNICCASMKGVRNISNLYSGDGGVRPTSDIDLILKESDYESITEVFFVLGYQLRPDGGIKTESDRLKLPLLQRLWHHPAFRNNFFRKYWHNHFSSHSMGVFHRPGVSVDVHRKLFLKRDFDIYPPEEIWRSAKPTGSSSVKVLDPLIELMLNLGNTWKNMLELLKHSEAVSGNSEKAGRYFKVMGHCDCVLLIQKYSQVLDWSQLLKDLRRFRAQYEIGGLLHIYFTRFPALKENVPPNVLKDLEAVVSKKAKLHEAAFALYCYSFTLEQNYLDSHNVRAEISRHREKRIEKLYSLKEKVK